MAKNMIPPEHEYGEERTAWPVTTSTLDDEVINSTAAQAACLRQRATGFNDRDHLDIKSYANTMRESRTWGTDVEMVAASSRYNRVVELWQPNYTEQDGMRVGHLECIEYRALTLT